MDDALRVAVEMNETIWGRLKNALEDLSAEEIDSLAAAPGSEFD
jgi:hypothetical protein